MIVEEQLAETLPAPPPNGCAWSYFCRCGRAYDRGAFLMAPLPRRGGVGLGLVWRQCAGCQTTMACTEEQLQEDAA